MRKKLLFAIPMIMGPLLTACFTTVNLLPSGPQPFHEKKLSGTGKEKILLVDLSGVITDQEQSSGFSMAPMPSPVAEMKEVLDTASKDPKIRAVILRINSPGGTVTASDLIYRELIHYKNRTGVKIIANIMDLGTSGGYYAAVAADKIVAHPTTVTGSIGVIMLNLNVEGLLEKIGINGIAIKSGEKKDMGSPFRRMTDEEHKVFQDVIDELYSRFVSVVSKGRKNLEEDDVRRIADGRIYTSTRALKLGLIDKIGYLDDALSLAKQEAGVLEAQLITYQRPGSYKANIYSERLGPTPRNINLINVNLNRLLPTGTPQFMYLWVP